VVVVGHSAEQCSAPVSISTNTNTAYGKGKWTEYTSIGPILHDVSYKECRHLPVPASGSLTGKNLKVHSVASGVISKELF
jgi:hypothetical protein